MKHKGIWILFVMLSYGIGFAQESQAPSEKSYEMDTVVVTASRTKEKLRDVSQNVTVFTASDIENSGAVSITDLLKTAGIQVYSEGAAGYGNEGLVIRGGRSSMHGFDIAGDILVLVDGHRTGSDSLGNIGLESTERIEVIRGPGAVQYGASAMGGVVNVITKKGRQTKQGSLEAGLGSFGEERYKAVVSGMAGKLDYAFAAGYATRNNYELGNGSVYENSDVEDRFRYNLNAGWRFNPANRLGLIVQGSDTNGAGKGEDAARNYNYYTRQGRENQMIDLSWEGANDSRSTTWLARYFMGEVNYDLKRFSKTSTTRLPLSENENDYMGSQLQASHDFGMFRAIAGTDWMSYDFDQRQDGAATSASRQNTAQSDFDNIGGFFMGELRLLKKKNLTLSAGLRYDTFDVSVTARKISNNATVSRDVDKDSFNPSLGVAYSPGQILKLRANYARAFKMPLPRQLTGYTIMMSTPFVGNPDLEPEISDNFDVGFDLDWESVFASVTWFYSDYSDMIGYETHSADAHYNAKHYWYYNVDSAEIQGIEFGVKFDVARYMGYGFKLSPYINWTHLLVFEDGNGYKLANRAEDSLAVGIVFAVPDMGLNLNLDATYYGKQYETDTAKGTSNTVSDSLLEDVGDAWVVDINCTKRLFKLDKWGAVNLKASLNNLFDEYYSVDKDSWMPGRSFYLGLEYAY